MPEKNPLGLGMRNMLGGIELWLVKKQINLVEIQVVPDHNIPGLLWSTHLLAGMSPPLNLSETTVFPHSPLLSLLRL